MQNQNFYKFCPKCATPLSVMVQMAEQRPVCPNCGWVQYEDPKVAAGVLVQRGQEVLLVRRTMEPFIRQWSIPAGFVNAYENAERAAERECFEETGLRVKVSGLFDIHYGREHPRGSDIFLVYRVELLGGELAAADDADQVGWFDINDLPSLAFESTRKIFKKLS